MAPSIAVNTLIASLGRLASVGLGVVAVSITARYLGGEQFGSYTVLMAYAAMLHMAADLGLYITLARTIAEHPRRENDYLAAIISLRLILILIAFGAGALVMRFLPSLRHLTTAYSIVAAGFAAQSFSQLLMGVYQKYGTVWRATFGDVLGRVVQVGLILALGIQRATLTAVSLAFALGAIVAAAVHHALLPQTVTVRLACTMPLWRRLAQESLPLGALLILNAVYFRIDAIILSFFQPLVEVGLYGIAYRLVESTLFFPAMFGGLLLPRLSAALKRARADELTRYVSESVAAVAWAAIFVAISFIILAEPIIILVAGIEYRAAAPLLQILSLALFAMFFGNLAGFTLLAHHQQKPLLVLAAALAAGNLVLNLITIPYWGAVAAAWTTVATEAAAALTATVMMYRRTPFSVPLKLLIRLAVAASATAAIFWLMPAGAPVIVTVLIGALVYVLGSRLLGIITARNFSTLLAAYDASL
ncbi:MAG: oligosaccharide flippase family protein [Candidatus Andersenbacteria bacterium]|nr:oligosaccharide flippase family protein [Candidatus Andersenbacteria bacterium]